MVVVALAGRGGACASLHAEILRSSEDRFVIERAFIILAWAAGVAQAGGYAKGGAMAAFHHRRATASGSP
jgi:hypothetical protein